MRARAPGAQHAVGALRVHAAGADSRSRSFRSTTTSPSATSGCPGMIGALGACFGRVVTMDSPQARPPGEFQWEATLWHELAHVITLQMSNQRVPRWLTEGISVYEEKRARPEWGREMDIEFAGMLNRGETIKLRELNAAFQNPKTISLAYYQASLLVEHLVTTYGDAGLHKLLRAYGQGLDTDAALKAALNTDFDQLQAGFDEIVERQFGAMRKALDGAAEGAEDLLRDVRRRRCRRSRPSNPRSFPVQMALGRALRKDGKLDEAMQAFERAAALVPLAGGKDSPHAQMAAIALEKKDTARAIAELTALVAVDFNNVDAARQLAALLRADQRRRSGEAAAGVRAHRRDRSVRRRRAREARPAGAAAQRGRRRGARVPHGARARAGRSGGGVHRSRGELLPGRQARRGEEADAGRARNRADLRARAGPAAQAGGADDADGGRPRARCDASRCCHAGARRCSPRVDAQLPAAPDDRYAGLQWRFVRIKYHFAHRRHAHPAGLLRRAVGHRRAGGRAEPVAPRQDGDRHPGRGSDPAHARRSAAASSTRGSTSSSRAACGWPSTRCRSCASSCCAAARRCSTISTARSNGTPSRAR